jgi:hypothetical protein
MLRNIQKLLKPRVKGVRALALVREVGLAPATGDSLAHDLEIGLSHELASVQETGRKFRAFLDLLEKCISGNPVHTTPSTPSMMPENAIRWGQNPYKFLITVWTMRRIRWKARINLCGPAVDSAGKIEDVLLA